MLRRRGIRGTSITGHADDTPSGKLMEATIESVDDLRYEDLAQEVNGGMRGAASRGFFRSSRAPLGYRRTMVLDGATQRPTLEVDPDTGPIVRETSEKSLGDVGRKEIAAELNERGSLTRAGVGDVTVFTTS